MENKALLIISSLILLYIVFCAPDIAFTQPKIVFDEKVHNFGEVMQGEVVEHTFVFHNKGNEELVIDKVSPS